MSFLNGLFATGDVGGYIIAPKPPAAQRGVELTALLNAINAGGPFGENARVAIDEIRGAAGVRLKRRAFPSASRARFRARMIATLTCRYDPATAGFDPRSPAPTAAR